MTVPVVLKSSDWRPSPMVSKRLLTGPLADSSSRNANSLTRIETQNGNRIIMNNVVETDRRRRVIRYAVGKANKKVRIVETEAVTTVLTTTSRRILSVNRSL